MVRESRISWQHIESEKDDDHEWIPNPTQTGEIQVRVSRELITGWHRVLDEIEALLNGKKLVPYWRLYGNRTSNGTWATPSEGKGINLYKVFHDPIEFDLVLFVQGTALERYLEDGRVIDSGGMESTHGCISGPFLRDCPLVQLTFCLFVCFL